MFVTVPDVASYSSVPLRFHGSPATISVSPSTGLVDGQRVRLTAKDTFAATVPVSRFLPDGQDCTDMFFEDCRISAIVLDAHGQPDDTFGVARLGDPGAYLSFAPES